MEKQQQIAFRLPLPQLGNRVVLQDGTERVEHVSAVAEFLCAHQRPRGGQEVSRKSIEDSSNERMGRETAKVVRHTCHFEDGKFVMRLINVRILHTQEIEVKRRSVSGGLAGQ